MYLCYELLKHVFSLVQDSESKPIFYKSSKSKKTILMS